MKVFVSILCILSTALFMGCGKAAIQKKSVDQNKGSVNGKNSDEIATDSSQKNNPLIDPSGQEIVAKGIDTTLLVIDTIITYSHYQLIAAKDKYDASNHLLTANDLEFNPIVIYILQTEADSIVYQKKFEENQFVSPYSFREKNLQYISLSMYSGGSGYMSTIYQVELGDQPTLKPVFNYNELTSYLFSKDGTQILFMQGIWEMSDDSEESHFSDHKYDIGIVDLTNKKAETRSINITASKYPSADYDFSAKKLLHMIYEKEPQTLKGVSLDKYPIE